MPVFGVVDNRTGSVVFTAETYSEASAFSKRDPDNLYISHIYRPGEVRL